MKSTAIERPIESIDGHLTSIDGLKNQQLGLPISYKPNATDIPAELIVAQPSKKDAIKLCIALSGRTQEQVCAHLEIDKAQWSRIMSGRGHFPENLETELMQFCGNHIPLQWQMHRCGFDPAYLRPLEDEKDRAIRERDAVIEQQRLELEALAKWIKR